MYLNFGYALKYNKKLRKTFSIVLMQLNKKNKLPHSRPFSGNMMSYPNRPIFQNEPKHFYFTATTQQKIPKIFQFQFCLF